MRAKLLKWLRREFPGAFPTPCEGCGLKTGHQPYCQKMLNYINRERAAFGQAPVGAWQDHFHPMKDAPALDPAGLRTLAAWCRAFGKGTAYMAYPRLEKLADKLEELSWNGCLTGDCPHQTQAECDAFLADHVRSVLGQEVPT